MSQVAVDAVEEGLREESLADRRADDRADPVRMLVEIARPKVIGLVVFTGLPALFLGKETFPGIGQAFWVLTGTALIGAACSAFNAVVERQTDARMARTRKRPLPTAALRPGAVTTYGLILTAIGTAMIAASGGWLAAAIGLGTIAFYVGVYTMWLKPRTPQNIVIGGAAGSTAPLIASAAMDGTVSPGALLLFAIVFLWTPPHFWAIAIHRKREYEAAGFPMMPSVVGDQPTRWRSLGYTLALIPVTLAPVWLGYLTPAFGVGALLLGLAFAGSVVRSLHAQRPAVDRRVFRDSIVYLTLLFLAMFVDLLVRWPLE